MMHKYLSYTLAIAVLMAILLYPSNVKANEQKGVIDKAFSEGFARELANRSFALLVTQKLSKNSQGKDIATFWQAYHKLEAFSAVLYLHISTQWQIERQVSWTTKLKASVMANMPEFLFNCLLDMTKSATEDYVQELKALSEKSYFTQTWFTQYMIEQEALQVTLLELAIAKDYEKTHVLVDKFLSQSIQKLKDANAPVSVITTLNTLH